MSGFKRFKNDICYESGRKRHKKNNSPVRGQCSIETDKLSTNKKQDKLKSGSVSELMYLNNSSTGSQLSTKTSNRSLTSTSNRSSTSTSNRSLTSSQTLSNTSFDSYKTKNTCTNIQLGKYADSPFSNEKEDKYSINKSASKLFDFYSSSIGNQSATKTLNQSSTSNRSPTLGRNSNNTCFDSRNAKNISTILHQGKYANSPFSNEKEDEHSKNHNASEFFDFPSLSTDNKSSTITSNKSSSNTSFDSWKRKFICSSVQCGNGTDSSFSLTKETYINSSYTSPSLHENVPTISNESIFYTHNKSSCSFKNESNGDASPIKVRDRSHSLSPSLVQPEDVNFDDLPSEHVEHSMSTVDDEMSDAGRQINPHDTNKNNVFSQESKSLLVDPALREFAIIDEIVSDQEENDKMGSNSGEATDSQLHEELPINDIDNILVEGLPENLKSSSNEECRQKVMLEEIDDGYFDSLPEGWIQIRHTSGMPVYLHKKSKDCSMTRPFNIGSGSPRNYKIPLSAIPCLHYQRASEVEKESKEGQEKEKQSQNEQSQSEIELMSANLNTLKLNKAAQSLEPSELHEYCKKAFKFKTLTELPFTPGSIRKKYLKMKKDIEKKPRPTLPQGTNFLKFPIKNQDGTDPKSTKEWIITATGKSPITILQEYVNVAFKTHPMYQFNKLENPATPHEASVFIENKKYGFGVGASKKQAKTEAAKAALEVLSSGVKDKIESDCQAGKEPMITKESTDSEPYIFDKIEVEDSRVAEFCAKSREPSPYAILLTCLGRNIGKATVIELSYDPHATDQPNQFTIAVGKHTAKVPCRNKQEGKQRAAQAILKLLHPNIVYWDSLLRLYGNRLIQSIKKKKKVEQEIVQLQHQSSLNKPNFAVLNKLKAELLELKKKREAVKTTGQFVLPNDMILPDLSSSDLNKLNL